MDTQGWADWREYESPLLMRTSFPVTQSLSSTGSRLSLARGKSLFETMGAIANQTGFFLIGIRGFVYIYPMIYPLACQLTFFFHEDPLQRLSTL